MARVPRDAVMWPTRNSAQPEGQVNNDGKAKRLGGMKCKAVVKKTRIWQVSTTEKKTKSAQRRLEDEARRLARDDLFKSAR